jgi:transcriptional regulator with XRE-family HTH domain
MHFLLVIMCCTTVRWSEIETTSGRAYVAVLLVRATDRDPHSAEVARRVDDVPASDQPRDPREEVRAEIREFLSTRRARITPEQAGLPTYGHERRRVTGLRREEVALLAGVSPQYYVRLERGDATGISESIIEGVAHALQLDDAERAHLVHLLRTAGTPRRARRRTPSAPERVRPTVQRLMDSMHGAPAVVLNGRLEILGANALGRALFAPVYADPEGTPSNARFVFLDQQAKTFFRDWDTVANDTVAILRAEAGRDPHNRDLSDLVGQLSTRSDDFRHRWAAHNVRIHSAGVKLFHHPVVGDLDLPYESLPLKPGSSTALVGYTPEPDTAAHDALALLASWAASEDSADQRTEAQQSKSHRAPSAPPDPA